MASVDGIVWPTVPSPTPAAGLVIVEELEHTQWWSPETLRAQQQAQLASVVKHAAATVPHYAGVSVDSLPILSRAQIIAAGDQLLSRQYPAWHGKAPEVATSRTSGQPVRVRGTGVVAAMNGAVMLREHRWHQRDLAASHASIRYAPQAPPPDGVTARGWSPVTALIAPDARQPRAHRPPPRRSIERPSYDELRALPEWRVVNPEDSVRAGEEPAASFADAEGFFNF